MKRMTKEEKLAREELTRTQVLNLNELERVARYEKRTSKKPAAILAVLGIICISIGVAYNPVLSFVTGTKDPTENKIAHKEVEESTTPEPVSTMNCQYTNLAAAEGYDTVVDMTLIFNNGKLSSYTKVMNITPTLGQEALAATTVPQLLVNYQAFETLTIPGYQIASNAKGTGFETIVSIDLSKLDSTKLISHHHNNVVTKTEFTSEDTKDTVTIKAQDLNYICQ